MTRDFDDGLDEIFGAPAAPAAHQPATHAPKLSPDLMDAADRGGFFERCPKCSGTGRFRGFGTCFACQGKGGKTFKTSPAARAQNRQQAQDRKVRLAEENWAAFKTAHPVAAQWIEEARGQFDFAQKMFDAVQKFGDLTERQLDACEHAAAKRAEARVAREAAKIERQAAAPEVTLPAIEAAFATAKNKGLQHPKLRFAGFEFSPAGANSANAGAIYIKRGGDYLGKVIGGRFHCARACDAETQAQIVQVAHDPKAAAVAYGKEIGRCSCCGRELTDPVSIANGIGPVCAENYGW